MTVICPGSFDPITNGHLDVINRASEMFDRVIVLILQNQQKIGKNSFSVEERMDFINRAIKGQENVVVDFYDGLLANYAKMNNINIIVKGLRAVSDFENEFQQAVTNKEIYPKLETVFIAADKNNLFLSSSMVKQIASLGGDISDFVPECVKEDILNKLGRK